MSDEIVYRHLETVTPEHLRLTYPWYARQAAAHLSAGDWLFFEAHNGIQVIGLALVSRFENSMELLSIAVARDFRRQGIASGLLHEVRGFHLAHGGTELCAIFRDDLANLPIIRSLLARNGWSEPATGSLVGVAKAGPTSDAIVAFASRFTARFGAQVVSWGDVTEEQRAALESKENTWYPRGLTPSRFAQFSVDPQISSAVVADEQVVGWLLARVESEEFVPVEIVTSYIHPAWQRRGTFLWMLARSIPLITARFPDITVSWTVSSEFPRTREFYRRRLEPLGVLFGYKLISSAPMDTAGSE